MKSRMKLALMSAFITAAMAPAVSFAQTNSGDVVAVVAGEPIVKAQLDQRIETNRKVAQRTGQNVTQAQLTEYSREELINDYLMLNEAKNARIKVSDEQVNAAVQEMAQANGWTMAQFEQRVKQDTGPDGWNMLQKDMRTALTKNALVQQEVLSKVKAPSAKEIDAEVARVSAIPDGPMSAQEVAVTQHIYVSGTDSKALKKAKAIKARLDKGEDFGAVAREVSESRETGQNGGAVPYIFLKDQTADPNVLKTVSSIEYNRASEPVKTATGYHIFRVSERTTVAPTAEDKKALAKDVLLQQRQEAAVQAWFKTIQAKRAALVKVNN